MNPQGGMTQQREREPTMRIHQASRHWPNHFKEPAVAVVGPKDQQSA